MITGHFTCTSESLIYCISCRKCSTAVYIGETARRLADRFREHRVDVIKKKGDVPVPHHFNSENHSTWLWLKQAYHNRISSLRTNTYFGNTSAFAGYRISDSAKKCDAVLNNRTLAPRGLNRDFSFM